MRRHIVPWLLATFLFSASSASAGEVNDDDRFKLWTNCLPVELLVESLHQDAADIGLTEEEITVAVRSRLRAAQLYEDYSFHAVLYVNVEVVGHSFSIDFSLVKWARDEFDNEGSARTWAVGSTGTHGKDPSFILSSVSRHTDSFIDEYLRVNADACE